MIKKIITILFCFTLFTSCITVNAQETSEDIFNKKEVLIGLGIIEQEDIGKSFSRNSFINALQGFSSDDVSMNPEDFVKNAGFLKKGQAYKGEYAITYDEAIQYAVSSLGYIPSVSNENYMSMANKLKLTDGINYLKDKSINTNDAIRLLYNMIEIEPMVREISLAETKYKILTGETLLGVKRNIKKVKGLVTANSTTSLAEEEGCGIESFRIDSETYKTDIKNTDMLLGRNVVAYIQDDDDESKLLYMVGVCSKNEELIVDAKDLQSISDDFSEITYTDNNVKTKRARLSASLKLIYNGVFYGDYTKDDLEPEVGNILLIDNSGDGVYDVIFVNAYESLVAESIVNSTMTIYSTFNYDGSLNCISFEDADYTIYKNEEKIEFKDINKNDILSVAQSKGSNKVIKAYVSEEIIDVDIQGINKEEKSIETTDGNYTYTPQLIKYCEEKNIELKVGMEYSLYIDYFGNIVYFKKISGLQYVMLYKAAYDEEQKIYKIKYMDDENNWQITPLAKKITYCNEKGVLAENAVNALMQLNPQVIRILLKSDGSIKQIDVAKRSVAHDENAFTKIDLSGLYTKSLRGIRGYCYFEDDAKLFIIPKDKTDESRYRVTAPSGFFAEINYAVTVYDVDEYSFSGVLSFEETDDSLYVGMSKGLFMVTGVSQRVDENDDVVSVIKGSFGENAELAVPISRDGIVNGISRGDIISIHIDSDGKVDYINKRLSTDVLGAEISPADIYGENGYGMGNVTRIDIDRISVKCVGEQIFRLNGYEPTKVYNRRSNRVEMISQSEIKRGDNVALSLYAGLIREIIVIRYE